MSKFAKTFTERRNLLADIVKNPRVRPGCYDKLAITNDGEILSADCCRKNGARIMSDIRDNCDTGWLVVALTYEAVSADYCRDGHDDLISNCAHCHAEFGEFGC